MEEVDCLGEWGQRELVDKFDKFMIIEEIMN